MKIFYLTTLLLTLGITATAQTDKGTLNINGLFGSNGGGLYQSNDGFTEFKLNVGAGTGYFVKNDWEIGAGIQFGVSRLKYEPPFDNIPGLPSFNQTYKYNLGIYSKYYFGNRSVRPYAVTSTGFNLDYEKQIISGAKFNGSSRYFNSGGGAGITWFPSKKMGLFTQLTYDHIYNDMLNQGSFNLNFGVQINLGKK